MTSAISVLGDAPRELLSGYARFASISQPATCFFWSAMHPQSNNASINVQPHFICTPARRNIANSQRFSFPKSSGDFNRRQLYGSAGGHERPRLVASGPHPIRGNRLRMKHSTSIRKSSSPRLEHFGQIACSLEISKGFPQSQFENHSTSGPRHEQQDGCDVEEGACGVDGDLGPLPAVDTPNPGKKTAQRPAPRGIWRKRRRARSPERPGAVAQAAFTPTVAG